MNAKARAVWMDLLAAAGLALSSRSPGAEELKITIVPLPALRVNGSPATAHTQGLEIQFGDHYVTARREDVQPRRALLLRTRPGRESWDVWDITPAAAPGSATALDHPGGMQSDGERLWIPLAESKPHGKTLVRAYSMALLIPGEPARAGVEFPVDDHIGAIAVISETQTLLGANWDTEDVYAWDFTGSLRRKFTSSELTARQLGFATHPAPRNGLTVQDWKVSGGTLFASGLDKKPNNEQEASRSRLLSFTNFFRPNFRFSSAVLPKTGKTEIAREAMAISENQACFLPEDLGMTNRLFRIPLTELQRFRATF